MPRVYVLDVDGVVIGKKKGFNFPFPHKSIIDSLRQTRVRGDHVCLCTGRALFATLNIIKACELDDPHISDGGSLIMNPLRGVIFEQYPIGGFYLNEILRLLNPHEIYLEFYTNNKYFIENTRERALTERHKEILGISPTTVQSLSEINELEDVIKVFVIAKDIENRQLATRVFEPLSDRFCLTWGMNANALPAQYGWITPKGISKRDAVVKLSQILNISLGDFIGVGDTISDWNFIDICGYCAAMGDGDVELIEKVKIKGEHGVVLKGSDINGLKEVFDLFS